VDERHCTTADGKCKKCPPYLRFWMVACVRQDTGIDPFTAETRFESRRARQFDKKLGTPKAVSLRLRPIQRTLGPLSVGAGLIAG
jgi:hypothetical protein